MPTPVFAFSATVEDRVSYGLGLAPERITATVRKRLFVERNRFVGKGISRVGSFTRRVLNLRRRSRPGKMPVTVARMWRGMMHIPNAKSIDGMTMQMGIIKSTTRPFVRGLIGMQEGYSQTSSKFMPVPVYDNLAKAGIVKGFSKAFKSMAAGDELITIRTGGQVLFVSKEMIERGASVHEATLFVGTKRVTVRPVNFGFMDKWNATWPGVQKRMGNAIKKEIRDIEKGYRTAN